jgi:hypothetical protein
MLRQFTFAGKHIEAEIAELPGSTRLDLKNIIARDGGALAGSAELLVLRRAVKSITVDGARHALRRMGKEVDVDSFPDFYDSETYEDLTERLTREAVAVNPWLAFRAPFSEVFAAYAPGEAEKDPTTLPATSTGEPSSTSDIPSREVS